MNNQTQEFFKHSHIYLWVFSISLTLEENSSQIKSKNGKLATKGKIRKDHSPEETFMT